MAAIERSDEVDPRTAETHDPPSASGGGAKYKLLSPAKLPISRSACLTIPPGLSPSSFLESPVLLSNMKVKPRSLARIGVWFCFLFFIFYFMFLFVCRENEEG